MTYTDRLPILLSLIEVSGIGPTRALTLLEDPDLPDRIWTAPAQAFRDYGYIDTETYKSIATLAERVDRKDAELKTLSNTEVTVIGYYADQYPASLRAHSAPPVLYCRGNPSLLSTQSVSVTGSREVNDEGGEWIHEVAAGLARSSYPVVSGGAVGVDAAAHRGAMAEPGSTVVVLGSGINEYAPNEHVELFENVADAGGLVLSQFPPDQEPTRYTFPKRNNTISALSSTLIVVATDGTGGTADQVATARDQGRRIIVPDDSIPVQPAAGIRDLRKEQHTIACGTAAEIEQELQEVPPAPTTGTDSEDDDSFTQTGLDGWS